MKIKISDDIIQRYPKINIGIVFTKGINIKETDPELEKLKKEVENKLKSELSLDTLVQHPFINAWRETYRSFGATKVKEHLPSAESLIRNVLKGSSLPKVNTLVDLYCMVSAKHLIPIGGYDLEKIKGDIILRFSKGGEKFLGLGKFEEWKETNPGEVVYADEEKILCRRWNYKDCKITAIRPETKNVCLQVDGAEGIPAEAVKKATEELAENIKIFCGGTVETTILSSTNLSFELKN